MNFLRRIKHISGRVEASWAKLFHEKTLRKGLYSVKYMFFDNDCYQLVVSFPACAPHASRYNYVRTLKAYNADKLFLLDDYAENHQGCYLVKDEVEALVCDLLKNITQQRKYRRIIFIGSSKGGYSALNFAFHIPGVDVVIGAPQYHLGSYLNKPNTMVNLKFLTDGRVDEESIARLDNRLREIIKNADVKPREVFIHYSNCEPTYEKHIKWMLEDLRCAGVEVREDVMDYPTHDDMVRFFPAYLTKRLDQLVTKS